MWNPCACCRRRPAAGRSQLEEALDACDSRRGGLRASLAYAASIEAACTSLTTLWPVCIVVLSVAFARWGAPSFLLAHWVALLVLAAAPEAVCLMVRWMARRRAAALRQESDALARRFGGLLERVKSELPMQRALAVLMTHDPDGDHKAFIECPPHLMKQVGCVGRAEGATHRYENGQRKCTQYVNISLGAAAVLPLVCGLQIEELKLREAAARAETSTLLGALDTAVFLLGEAFHVLSCRHWSLPRLAHPEDKCHRARVRTM